MTARFFLIVMCGIQIQSLHGQAPADPEANPDAALSRTFMRVPVRIDEDMILSDLLLEAQVATIGLDLEAFSEAVSSPSGRAFSDLLSALEAGRIEEAGSFHKPSAFSQIVGVDLATAYVKGFAGGWDGARVLRRYALGPEDVFVWELQMEGRGVPRAFRIASQGRSEGAFWLENQSTKGLHALKTVITDAERLVAEGNAGFVDEQEALDRSYRRDVPGTEAAWRFDGASVNWDAFDEAAAVPAHQAAAFYVQACAALRSGEPEAYAEYFSPTSALRFRDWVEEMGDERYAAFVNDAVEQGRRVVFFLEAMPATFVFYLTTDGRLEYETLHQDAEGDYKIVSFYMYGLVDNILQDADFFQRSVILPIAGGGEPVALGANEEKELEDPPSSAEPVPNDPADSGAVTSEIEPQAGDGTRQSVLIPILIGVLLVGLVALVLYLAQKRK